MSGPAGARRTSDLNCDLGEDPARIADGSDFALMAVVTSVNVACGGHAGDEGTMEALVREAVRLRAQGHAVAVGAHPSFPDRGNFGRVDVVMGDEELERSVAGQIAALAAVAGRHGVRLSHVKPHGALYHAASMRRGVAEAIARAVDPGLVLVGLAGSAALATWRAMGRRVMAEAFADRRYEADGSLRARRLPGAVLSSAEAAAQAARIARGEGVIASDGAVVELIGVETICVHSDSPGAIGTARAIRRGLTEAGWALRPSASPGSPGPA